jgi:hypothetical protein
MKTSTLPAPKGIIEWPGSEPLHTTRDHAINTLRACAFIREEVSVTANGSTRSSMDIARPTGISEEQATIVQETLLHRIYDKLCGFLPMRTPVRFVGPEDAPWDDGWMLEIGDGWTLGPTVELHKGYRSAIKWHAYGPEGDPIAENTTEQEAAVAVIAAIAAYNANQKWNA